MMNLVFVADIVWLNLFTLGQPKKGKKTKFINEL